MRPIFLILLLLPIAVLGGAPKTSRPTPHVRHKDCVECPSRLPGGGIDDPAVIDETISIAPEKDACSDAEEYRYPSGMMGDFYTVYTVGASIPVMIKLENTGVNRIIPKSAEPGGGPKRIFSIKFPERARQDLHFAITDVPTNKLSESMESYFYVFPRKLVPSIMMVEDGKKLQVTLPTGEHVYFNTESKEIAGGVLKEGAPIDLGPDRFKRGFADVSYAGKGVSIRVDRRGSDPRLGTTATITTGSPDPSCAAGQACRACKVASEKLWNQSGKIHFKFPTDAEFDVFLKANCKFRVPSA